MRISRRCSFVKALLIIIICTSVLFILLIKKSTERQEDWRRYKKIRRLMKYKRYSAIGIYPKPTKMRKVYLSFRKNFSYPLDVNMSKLVDEHATFGETKVKQINTYRYVYLSNPSNLCGIFDKDHKPLDMLFLIKSAPGNFKRRKVIRETWANETVYQKFNFRRLFLVGISEPESLSIDLNYEINETKDILQLSFLDTYYKNTVKTLGGLKWVVEYCNATKFVIIADDDFYFGTNVLWEYLQQLSPAQTANFIMGKKGQHYKVERFNSGKWSVNVSVWPYDAYPPYLLAGTIIMSTSVASKLFIASLYTKSFIFDDVYIGILCYKLGIPVLHNKDIMGDKNDFLFRKPRYLKFVLAAHGFSNPKRLAALWSLKQRYKL